MRLLKPTAIALILFSFFSRGAAAQSSSEKKAPLELRSAPTPLLSSPEAERPRNASFTIKEVIVEGNSRIEKDAILEKMSLKAGKPYVESQVRSDILSIFGMGFFEDVAVDESSGVLKVSVRERPVITKIEYKGSAEFENKDLEEASGLKAFHVVNLSKIRAAQAAIAKKYEEKGYYLARAEYSLKPVPGRSSEVELTFDITENSRVRIRKIFFLGNHVFNSGELKQAIATSEGHVFSWATSGGTYREAAFERDISLLAYFYANEGYIEAKFNKPRVTLSQDRRYIDIVMDITEGKQYFLGKVTFQGDDLFTEQDLQNTFGMKENDVFSAGKLQEEVVRLTDKYGDQGYAFANVIPRNQIREGTQIVDLTFDIERGEKVYWGKVLVTGNTKTHDKVIRRELPFHEGELYNATKRKKGVERVRRLGFFGNEVSFLTSTPKGSTNVLDLEIRVTEKPTGSLNVSAGYGSGSGMQFGAQVSQQNLFGRGQQLSFSFQYNKYSKTFNFEFVDPKVFDSEWLFGTSLYLQESTVGNPKTYDQELKGMNFRIGREIAENWNVYEVYKLEQSKLKDAVSDSIFTNPEKDKNSIISSLATTLAYDSRNNRLDPSGGEYFSMSSEFAGLGGRTFQKYLVNGRMYRKVFWKVVARSNMEYGYLTNNFNHESVPDSERFILGGVFSLRGYPQSSVGPERNVVNTREKNADGTPTNSQPFPYVIGGVQKFVFNQEIESPLIPEADIRVALFFDAGNSWNNTSQISPILLANYGWGIRWYSPLGPLRFEWGFPLATTTSKTSKSAEFHFIIAPTF